MYMKWEEQRGNIYPWKPVGLSSCKVSLGFSLHLQDLDVFCPCASHHAWLIHLELPAASSQDTVQTRMLMEIPARRGYVGKETKCLVKELGTQMMASAEDLECKNKEKGGGPRGVKD